MMTVMVSQNDDVDDDDHDDEMMMMMVMVNRDHMRGHDHDAQAISGLALSSCQFSQRLAS